MGTLERAQGYLKLPNGRALSGHSHDYKRHGTSTLFAAFDVASGKVTTAHTQRGGVGSFSPSWTRSWPPTLPHRLLVQAVHLVVHVQRTPHGRKVEALLDREGQPLRWAAAASRAAAGMMGD